MSEIPNFTRRGFFGAAAAIVAAASSGLPIFSRRLEAMAETLTKDKVDIRSFKVTFPEAQITDLRARVKATKWPERETVTDATQGVQLATMQALAKYWATEHDWSKAQARLNSFPQFITEIDGLDIHFIHARSKHDNAMPLIITHGWPGSVIEQLKVLEPLTNPTAHGGTAADAFHVVVPSLPGYGFSGKPKQGGISNRRIAGIIAQLMARLGYTRYGAQGGDWGGVIVKTTRPRRSGTPDRPAQQHVRGQRSARR